MPSVKGFPPGTRYTPVPSPLLGPLLREIDDLAELKCTLRLIWLLSQKKGYPRYVALSELLADGVLVAGLEGAEEAVRRGVGKAVARGTVLSLPITQDGVEGELLFLNTESDRRAMEALSQGELEVRGVSPKGRPPMQPPASGTGQPNIFTLYEENIGLVTPLLAEELKEAEATYPWAWVQDAFKEAVSRNRRNWRYIQRILERWAAEGRSRDGEPGRHTEAIDRKEYLRRYGRGGGT